MKNRERMLVQSRKDHFTHHLLTVTGLSVNSTSILSIGIIFVRLSGCENDSVTFPAFISGSLQFTDSITMTFPIVASTPAREVLYTINPPFGAWPVARGTADMVKPYSSSSWFFTYSPVDESLKIYNHRQQQAQSSGNCSMHCIRNLWQWTSEHTGYWMISYNGCFNRKNQ